MRPLVLLALLLPACHKDKEEEPTTPPAGTLALTTPAPAAWTASGASQASGTSANVTSLTVNGAIAHLPETGEFTADIQLDRGINIVEAVATDERGDTLFARNGVLAGDFGDPDGAVSNAVQLRVNQGGLDKICTIAEGIVTADTANSALPTLNPVVADSYLGVDVLVNLDSVTFGAPQLTIDPSPSVVSLQVVIPTLALDASVYADAGVLGEYDTGFDISASSATIKADLILGTTDGQLGVTLMNADVQLQDFAVGVDFLSFLDDVGLSSYRDLLGSVLQSTVEGMLVDQITTLVPPVLEATLAGLAPSFSTDLMGRTVNIGYAFADAGSDDDGLTLSLDLDVDFPSSGDHTYNGFLTAPFGEPEVDRHADLGAALSDDLLNLTLFEAWRSGILELRLSTDDGSLDPILLTQFKATQGTITTFASLPPVIVEKGGGLVAQVGEMIVTVDTPGGELGEHLVVAINGEIPLEVLIEDGALVLDVGSPALTMMVRDSDWGASNDTVTTLMESALPLDTLLALLGNLSFPLPELYGIRFDSGTAHRDDDGVHTDTTINLD